MDRETDFRDGDGNVEALTGWESDSSDEDQLYDGENCFSTEDQEIGADSNEEILSGEAIWVTIEYGGLDFIVPNL